MPQFLLELFLIISTVLFAVPAVGAIIVLIISTIEDKEWKWSFLWVALGCITWSVFSGFALATYGKLNAELAACRIESALHKDPVKSTNKYSVEYNGQVYEDLRNGRFSSNCAVFDTESGDTVYFRGDFLIREVHMPDTSEQ